MSTLQALTDLEAKFDGQLPQAELAAVREASAPDISARLFTLKRAAQQLIEHRREALNAGRIAEYRNLTEQGNAICAMWKSERDAVREGRVMAEKRTPNRKCAPVTFGIAEKEKNGRVEYQLLNGNRIIARSFDRTAIDAAWNDRAALAKARVTP